MMDWEELEENVWPDFVLEFHQHREDTRGCYYHPRLKSWVFQTEEFVIDKKCLRNHEGALNG